MVINILFLYGNAHSADDFRIIQFNRIFVPFYLRSNDIFFFYVFELSHNSQLKISDAKMHIHINTFNNDAILFVECRNHPFCS